MSKMLHEQNKPLLLLVCLTDKIFGCFYYNLTTVKSDGVSQIATEIRWKGNGCLMEKKKKKIHLIK